MTTKDKTIFRIVKDKDNPYVMMDKRPIEKPYLSWKAKGILSYLLSRPDDWEVNLQDLVNRSTDGEHATRSGVKELIKVGHIERVYEREKGRIKRVILKVHEQPLRGFQQVDNPQVEKPQVDNHPLTNTDRSKKDRNNKKEGAPSDAELIFKMLLDLSSVPTFKETWAEWYAYRKERGKKLLDTTIKRQLQFLLEDKAHAPAIMEQSMTAGWLGLFPLKQSGHAPKPAQPVPAPPSEEELNRQRADVAAKVKERDAKRKAGIREVDDIDF